MRRIENITGISGVGAGQTALIQPPCDRRYFNLKFFVSATVDATATTNPLDIIENIQIMVDGKQIRNLIASDYINIAKTNGIEMPATPDHVPVYFAEPWRRTMPGEELTTWDMVGRASFDIKVKFKSTAVSPSLTVAADYDYERNFDGQRNFLQIVHYEEVSVNAPAGEFTVTTLQRENPVSRFHLVPSSGQIDAVNVKIAGITYLDTVRAQYGVALRDAGFTRTFNESVIFDIDQQVTSAVNPVGNQIDFKITSSAPNSLRIIQEVRKDGFR